MQDTSALLAEAVGRPGNEDLAPLLAEVQWLERSNRYLMNFVLSGRDALKVVSDDMEDSYSPERMAELEVMRAALEASGGIPERKVAGMTKEEALNIAMNGTNEEVSELLHKLGEQFGIKLPSTNDA